MTFEAINLISEKSYQQCRKHDESLANGITSWLAANGDQHIAAVTTICTQPKRWEMTQMTEYQMDSDELRRQNTSNTMEAGAYKSVCLYILGFAP